ncbi:hypothetical protein AN958_01677 [Leucoagaricus sp. SymC.cos]|nr:hypothetical protein AN958_01677 [Leucoagaricus sp. SymC.cos]
MSHSWSFPLNVTSWVMENFGDPATKDFLPKLKDHLLSWLEGAPPRMQYMTATHNFVHFADNHIYQHKHLRINYTTYDMQHAQDSVNPQTHPDIMVLASSPSSENSDSETISNLDDHPYLYARVVGIFYAEVQWIKTPGAHPEVETKSMDFLWVHWLVCDICYLCNFGHKRLPHLEFASDGAFSFLDPDVVLHSCHLIPAYAYGQVSWLGPSLIHCVVDDHHDWQYHYANIFVDCDMFMRYQGGSVSHGPLAPNTDQSSFMPKMEVSSENEDDIAVVKGSGWQEVNDLIDKEECSDYGYINAKDDDFGPPVNSYDISKGEDMDEDGEGLWDDNCPENDSYRTFN